MTMPTYHNSPEGFTPPRLSDDAVIQIHDFIHHILDHFEARYGDQIHRFYQDLGSDALAEPQTHHDTRDPPF